jgi:tetratricopeptide (TPR) repeat protein
MSTSGTERNVVVLAQAALGLMRERRLDDAARVWSQVLAIAPDHPQALFHMGQHSLLRKDLPAARQLLERAARADSKNPAVSLNLAFVSRAAGDNGGEMAWLVRSLTIDPYFFPALLAKGMLEERTGAIRQAARTFRDVLAIAPPENQLTGEMQQAVKHARDAVNANAATFGEFLRERLATATARHASADLGRFEECRDIAIGTGKAYPQQPTMLLVPRLPAIPFYDNADFPWLKTLEAATDTIRDEFLAAFHEDNAGFRPYVDHPDGMPINQWAELNHSMKWNALFLWKDGVCLEERRCPKTVALLSGAGMAEIPGYAPTAFFSVLQPRTTIPPHTGVTNARLIVHLPLIVPKGCRFRVGSVTRDWRPGEAFVFDDTIEHAAWNDSDEFRAILILDIWNPYLSAAEREMICGLLAATRDYYGGIQPASF